MKTLMGPHTLEFQDTGAPSGVCNNWYVKLNGILLYSGNNLVRARVLHDNIIEALEEAYPGRPVQQQ